MKKLQLTLLLLISIVSNYNAQVIGANTDDKIYKAWKSSKLYVVKSVNEEINTRLEEAVKASFPNYTATVSEAEADKLMDNEGNFFACVYYPGQYKTKLNTWDKYAFGIGIFQGKEKKLQKTLVYENHLVRYDYLPIAPNMNLDLVVAAAREAYTKTGLDKTFKVEPNILIMIQSTIIGFKQTLDALDKTAGVTKPIDVYKAVAKTNREKAPMLKDKTLLILDNEITEPFYTAYKYKKEKIQVNDLSKLDTKDKKYCMLIYTIEVKTSIRQISVIDCETGKIIYQDSGRTATTGDKMSKKYADNMHMAIDGKSWD